MFRSKVLVGFMLLCTAVFCLTGVSLAGESNKLRIAVFDFTDNASKDSFGKVITGQLNFTLTKFKRFIPVDSAQVQKAMTQVGISVLDNVDSNKLERFQGIINLDIIIYGTISSLGTDTFFTDVKVFDVKNGKTIGLESQTFSKEAEIPAIAQKVVVELQQRFPMRGLVAKVSENQVYLNIGSEAGVKVGDIFTVYHNGDSITDPATGKVIGVDKTQLAKVRIKSAEAEYAVGDIIETLSANKIAVSDQVVALFEQGMPNENDATVVTNSNTNTPATEVKNTNIEVKTPNIEVKGNKESDALTTKNTVTKESDLDTLAKKELSLSGAAARFISFSPNGKSIAFGSENGSVKLLDVDTGAVVASHSLHKVSVNSMAFSPDGKYMATVDTNGKVVVWDLAKDEKYREFAIDENLKSTYGLNTNKMFSFNIGFSSDGKLIAEEDSVVTIWDLKREKKLRSFNIDRDTTAIAFSPDGKTIVTGGRDGKIRFWETSNGRQMLALDGHKFNITTLAFTPDGKMLASGSKDKDVKLWDVSTGKEIRLLSGNKDSIMSVTFSPDGKKVAAGSEDGIIRIWETDTGNELTRLQHKSVTKFLGMNVERSTVLSITYSPDGKTIASLGSYDIKLWDCNNKKTI